MNVQLEVGNGKHARDRERLLLFLRKYGAALALLALIIVNMAVTPNFASVNTIWNIIIQSSTIMLVAIGMTLVIAGGGIDISVGSIMAASSITMAYLMNYGIVAGVVGALLIAVLLGTLNGAIISFFKIQPLVVTLAMMTAIRGAAQLINDGRVLGFTDSGFTRIAYYRIAGHIPIQLIIIILVVAIGYFLMNKMSFGRYVEAIGDNEKAAVLAGIRIPLVTIAIYGVCAMLAGMGGILETARLSAADANNMGKLIELDAIAAVAIGGTALTGGRPHIIGTVIGVFIMQIITVMVNMNNIPYSYSLVIKTIIIVAAVYLQRSNK